MKRLFFYLMAALVLALLFIETKIAVYTLIFALCCIILMAAYLVIACILKVCNTRENDINPFN